MLTHTMTFDPNDIGHTPLNRHTTSDAHTNRNMAASSSSSCEEKFHKTVTVWVTKSKSLRILIFGKTGTGKSSLINTLFDEKVAREGRNLHSETKVVESFTKTMTVIVNDVRVTLWDTPGLKDPSSDGEKTINEIKENCLPDVDLFVYCAKFNETRLGQDDVDCIHDITSAFGGAIWKRALFALTFANETRVPPSSQATLQEHFLSREAEWKEALHQVVQDNVKPEEMPIGKIQSIPVVPTGYRGRPLPGDREWFTDFWAACLLRVNFVSIPALIRASNGANCEAQRAITARIVGQRLAEIGGELDIALEEEESTDRRENVLETVPPERVTELLLETIRNDQDNLMAQLLRGAGNAWARYGTYALVAAGAVILSNFVLR